jgi:putative membrane protein
MNSAIPWVIVVHVFSIVFWIGSLLTATQLLRVGAQLDDAGKREGLFRGAVRVMKAGAHPGAALTIVTGILLIYLEPVVLRMSWLHGKLLLVGVMIALDVWLYRTIGKISAGTASRATAAMLHGLISLVLFGILAFVLVRPI